jgi:8-oxo-dGTP pyrophosphatase MutT (NUDIX family)
MFRYCPSCASKNIRFEDNHVFRCPDCGFVYYHNTAAAAALVIDTGERIAFVRRAKEPASGKLDLPGGFVDPRESIIDALVRECYEELNWKPARDALSLFASFPNVYPYKNIVYNTCDMFFAVHVRDFYPETPRLQRGEIAGLDLIKYGEIDTGEIAFDSVVSAIKVYLESIKRRRGTAAGA